VKRKKEEREREREQEEVSEKGGDKVEDKRKHWHLASFENVPFRVRAPNGPYSFASTPTNICHGHSSFTHPDSEHSLNSCQA